MVKNWYQDRYETVLIQRNFLFISVLALIVVFGFSILGVIELNNTKVYEPFIVQVEENTGIITKVNNSEVRNLPAEKAVRNASLVRYILAREAYSYTDYQFNYYQIVRLMSDKNTYSVFSDIISPANSLSPVSLGFDKKIDLKIKSLIDLDEKKNLVQIRVSKALIPAKSSGNDEIFKQNQKDYVITLTYSYANLNLSETERYINPLGIQVTSYTINEEVNAKTF